MVIGHMPGTTRNNIFFTNEMPVSFIYMQKEAGGKGIGQTRDKL